MLADLTGKKFGRLTAAWPAGYGSRRRTLWLCFCDCGKHHVTPTTRLTSGKTKSCGCYRASAGWTSRKGRYTPERRMFINVRSKAKSRGQEFNLDFTDIMIPATCPLLGIPLYRGKGRAHDGSPTLDRIDSTKGYLKGNVWVISEKANRIKTNATLQELEAVAKNWRRLRGDSD